MSSAKRSASALAILLLLAASATPARAADEGRVVSLPEGAAQMCTGGGGRLLIFHLKGSHQLAVVDVVKAKIVHAFEMPDDDIRFAADADSLFVAFTAQKLLHRYSLTTFQREKTVPFEHAPILLSIGSGSTGPLMMLTAGGPTYLLDPQTLKPYNVDMFVYGGEIRASADGQTFVTSAGSSSPLFFNVLRLDGLRVTKFNGSAEGYAGAWFAPAADGSLIFRNGSGITTGEIKPVAAETVRGASLLPTESPAFFLAMRGDDARAKVGDPLFRPNPRYAAKGKQQTTQVGIYASADCRLLYTIHGLEPIGEPGIRWGYFQTEPRIRYLPKEKLLVTVPTSDDGVVIRDFDLAAALKKSGEPFLFVVSKPPSGTEVGKDYHYQMEVLSGSGGVKYELESGPQGMTVSPSGEVRWKVSADAGGANRSVVVSLHDAGGKETFHSFSIAVAWPASSPAGAPAVATQPAAPSNQRPAPRGSLAPPNPAGAPPPPSVPAVAEVTKIGADRLQLPAGNFACTPGLDDRSMLLLQGDRLVVLAADGITIEKRIKLPKAYTHIAERADCYVALAADPKAVEVIDKKTLTVRKSLKLACNEFTDLALHPRLPISYVAMKKFSEGPNFHFVVFNEKTGDGHESDEYVGTWIKPDPRGKFLMVGYRDIYEEGSRLLVNPGRVDVVPEYGDISWLIRYSLDDEGMPTQEEIKEKAGGNGQGLRMSRDARRVTYLSFVGYPEFSGNLAGWDPMDLKKIPVTYATKDRATTHDLAYHPTLPLVASPGGGSAVFFQRETGDIEDDRLANVAETLAGTKVQSVQFSPDGKNLIFDATVGNVHYLIKAALRLSAAETRIIEQGPKSPAGDAVPAAVKVAGKKPPLKDLEALKGGLGKAMTSREIGKWFMDSVVVVRGEGSAGTGYVVGSGGYIVTCAHCLPHDGKMTVSYRDSSGDEPQTRTAEPRVVAVDESRDLALLKINVAQRLRPVRLGGGKVESGERVSVIGNPGIGQTILDYTMTEGIVSSPLRELEGQKYVQTSAQVNPGSSGAPLFNSRGLVIGTIVLKARIEGAGFAIPADDVSSFLAASASTQGADGRLARLWSDSAGERCVEATFLGFDGEKVKLERADGHVVAILPKKLGAGDQEFLRRLRPGAAGEVTQLAEGSRLRENSGDASPADRDASSPRSRPRAAASQANLPAGTKCVETFDDSEKVIDWLREKNSLGARSKLVADMSGFIETQGAAERGFYCLFGGALAKSSHFTILGGHNDEFFAADVPASLMKHRGFPEKSAVTIVGIKNAPHAAARASLSDPIIDGGYDLDRGKEITGSAVIRDLAQKEGDYAFRLTYLNVELYDQIGNWIQVKHEAERVRFEFVPPKAVDRAGPMLLFLEVCHYRNRGENDFVSVSNTVAVVVNAK